MIKNNKWKLILSSTVILLPIVVGLILWNKLPAQLATHWGTNGNADGFSGRGFAVFGLPLFMLVMHWICILFTVKDPKNKGQNKKVFGMVLWICPVLSLLSSGIIYSIGMGVSFNINMLILPMLGLMFAMIGNYLPKCKQNHTIGIKVKWTLANEKNWNATHRFAGKVWVIGGLLLAVLVFLPEMILPWILVPILLVLAITPMLYSYLYYKKTDKDGSGARKGDRSDGKKQ